MCWDNAKAPAKRCRHPLGRTSVSRLLPALLLLLAAAVAAQGRKTDVITLYNGDHITGEIKSLKGGILQFSTSAMSTVQIEWPEIASVRSAFHYEVRLSNGERLYGSFASEARPGQVLLADTAGTQALESLQVVEIRPIKADFLDRFDLYLAATVSYTKASNIGQAGFNAEISYEDEKSVNTFDGRVDTTGTDNNSTSSSRLDLNRAVWSQRRTALQRSVFASFESNDELDLDSRVGVGAGVGRYFIDTHRSRLIGNTGLQVITESKHSGGSNQDVELFLNTIFAAWKFTTPELDIRLAVDLYPSVTDPGRLRSNSNLRLRWEVVEDLYWDVTAWATTDNQSDTGTSSDYAVTTGVGWKY